MKHVAILDDDKNLRDVYEDFLGSKGFKVSTFATVEELEVFLETSTVDAFILDISLPGATEAGLLCCQTIRQRYPTTPIVVFSALNEVSDEISAYRMGADNYVVKGGNYGPSFLLVILEASIRRSEQIALAVNEKDDEVLLGKLLLNRASHSVYWDKAHVSVSIREFKLVEKLVDAAGKAVSLDKLMRAAGIHVEDNTVSILVRRLRGAFKEVDPEFDAIVTERGLGYRWVNREV